MDAPHEEILTHLSDFLDGHLTAHERDRVVAHLATCSPCATVARELEEVREAARALGSAGPPRDLWPSIRSRLGEAEVVPLPLEGVDGVGGAGSTARASRSNRRSFRFTVPQLAAAGLALMLGTGAVGWGIGTTMRGPADAPETAAAPAAAGATEAGSVLPGARAASEDGSVPSPDDSELATLEAILDAGRDRLQPRTLRLLEKNLAVIERAIAESRAALEIDPGNAYVEQHLRNAMERRREYLREAAALVEEAD